MSRSLSSCSPCRGLMDDEGNNSDQEHWMRGRSHTVSSLLSLMDPISVLATLSTFDSQPMIMNFTRRRVHDNTASCCPEQNHYFLRKQKQKFN